MGQTGAVPTPAPRECGVVVIQRWEGPRPLGSVWSRGEGEEGELASAPGGKTRSAEAQAEPRAPKTGCCVVVPHPAAQRAWALGWGRGWTEDLGLPWPPLLGARNCLVLKSRAQARDPAGALRMGVWADSWAPSGASAPRHCTWSFDLRTDSFGFNRNFLSAYHRRSSVLGAVLEKRRLIQAHCLQEALQIKGKNNCENK